eukprot:1204535-Pleurochrysis_carterae.AAC.1
MGRQQRDARRQRGTLLILPFSLVTRNLHPALALSPTLLRLRFFACRASAPAELFRPLSFFRLRFFAPSSVCSLAIIPCFCLLLPSSLLRRPMNLGRNFVYAVSFALSASIGPLLVQSLITRTLKPPQPQPHALAHAYPSVSSRRLPRHPSLKSFCSHPDGCCADLLPHLVAAFPRIAMPYAALPTQSKHQLNAHP